MVWLVVDFVKLFFSLVKFFVSLVIFLVFFLIFFGFVFSLIVPLTLVFLYFIYGDLFLKSVYTLTLLDLFLIFGLWFVLPGIITVLILKKFIFDDDKASYIQQPINYGVNYREYLRSPAWRAKKRQKLEEVNYTCERCGVKGRKLDIHHLHYDTLGFEKMSDLLAVCRKCHLELELEKETNKEAVDSGIS